MIDKTVAGTSNQRRLLAKIAHELLHILDAAEENAQTGVVSLEISTEDWTVLNDAIEQISDDPHETLHDLIDGNEAHAVETDDPLLEALHAIEALTRYGIGITPDQRRLAKVYQIASNALRPPAAKANEVSK